MNRFLDVNRTGLFACLILGLQAMASAERTIDLREATIVHSEKQGEVERTATRVLVEEVAKRTGLQWKQSTQFPDKGPAIIITTTAGERQCSEQPPARIGEESPATRPEGYRIVVQGDRPTVWIIGADGSGTLYGVGRFLRLLQWSEAKATFPAKIDLATAPQSPIRGHQLGYRNTANSYDAWNVDRYEQYIRELTFFGANAIENIPMSSRSPHMPIEPAEMHRNISSLCKRYGMQYWIWMPAAIDLTDTAKRENLLDRFESVFQGCDTLTGVFVPGGDPGNNMPEHLLAFLKAAARRLKKHHPKAGMWMSLQRFSPDQARVIYDFLEREKPDWLGGIVAGPSSRPIPELRKNVPDRYPIRLYPDITHNKICQYPVPWWDLAYALTLGREAINPRPVAYAQIHNWFAPYTDGFISYSDGAHDDLNKAVWSALGWDATADLRDIVTDYARVFFSPKIAEDAADGIFALERNWRGVLRYNASVNGTLLYWQALEKRAPELADNWRWQMCLLRATYDAYIRRRLLQEEKLERQANAIIAQAGRRGSDVVINEALAVLRQAVTKQAGGTLRGRIIDLCESLFRSVGLQTSVKKYQAANPERGAILDFIDVPLNNRWWLEDEFKKIRDLPSEADKVARLKAIAAWERPGPGSYYDDVGNPAKSPHVKHSEEVITVHGEEALPAPMLWWLNNGKSRIRKSCLSSMDYPEAVVYEGLDPHADYTVRCAGYGKFLLRIDGERTDVKPEFVGMGVPRDFPVPRKLLVDRKIVLTWDRPTDEGHLNWRQQSRLCEVWLLKQNP